MKMSQSWVLSSHSSQSSSASIVWREKSCNLKSRSDVIIGIARFLERRGGLREKAEEMTAWMKKTTPMRQYLMRYASRKRINIFNSQAFYGLE